MSTKHSVYSTCSLIYFMVNMVYIIHVQIEAISVPSVQPIAETRSLFMHNKSIYMMKRIYITIPWNIKNIWIHEWLHVFTRFEPMICSFMSYCSIVLTKKRFRNSITNSPTNTNIMFVYLYVLLLVIQTQ